MKTAIVAVAVALLSASVMAAPSGDDGADSLLPADQAFQLLPAERHGATLALQWAIAPGYFLYRTRIHVVDADTKAAPPLALALPTGMPERDPMGGSHEVYRSQVSAKLALGTHVPHNLRVTYQGCADAGVCYPPQTRVVPVPAP
jgi:thiol:disulfide interchange protein DsbD